MKKNGFTTVELITTFALTMVIAILLFELVLSLKQVYINAGVKSILLNKQVIMTEKLYNDFNEKEIIIASSCGKNCLVFIFDDYSRSILKIDKENKIFTYGDYTIKLDGSSNFGDISVDNEIVNGVGNNKNNSIIKIQIPITSNIVAGNYGINVAYQYNSRVTAIDDINFDIDDANNRIFLKDGEEVYVEPNTTWIDPGYYTVVGDVITDNDSRVVITGLNTVDTTTLGTYNVTYELHIDGELIHTITRKVIVRKEPKPLIPELVAQTTTSTDTTEGFKDNNDGTYTYTGAYGTGGTNWLWYGGHLWRIMKVNSNDNTMELITSYPVTSINLGPNGCVSAKTCNTSETSYIGTWLNEIFLTSLPTTAQNSLVPMTYTRYIYNGSSAVSEEVSNVKVRLLTTAEYSAYSGADKYLDIKNNYWLADIKGDSGVGIVRSDGETYDFVSTSGFGVRPLVKVFGITFTEGDGSLTSPYVASTSNAKKTTNIEVGEYVSVPTTDVNNPTYLTRVVSQTGGTKVALNGLYTTSVFGDTTTFSKSSTVYTGALTTFKETLDTAYFDSSDKNYNITRYSDGSNHSTVTSTVASDIGLLSVGEMFSGNDIDLSESLDKTFVDSNKIVNQNLNYYSWLMNSYSDVRIDIINGTSFLDNLGYAATSGVRPAWYLKDVTITGGSGTANDPYLLK